MPKAIIVSDNVSRKRPRTPSYLVRRDQTWFFQIRVPRSLSANHSLPPLRAKLQVDSHQRAQQQATALAFILRGLFQQWAEKSETMTDTLDQRDAEAAFAAGAKILCARVDALRRRLSEPASLHTLSWSASWKVVLPEVGF